MDIELKIMCVNCRTVHVVTVPKEGYVEWMTGTTIQKAMPNVSASDRGLLISNICGKCFDEIFRKDN